MGASDSAWLFPCWKGWDVGTEGPYHTARTCLGQCAKRAKVCLGRSLGGEQGVGWGAGTSGGGTQKLAEGFVGSAWFELGCVLHLHKAARPPSCRLIFCLAGASQRCCLLEENLAKPHGFPLCPRGFRVHLLTATLVHS